MKSSMTLCITLVFSLALMSGCAKKGMVQPTQHEAPAATSVREPSSPATKEETAQAVEEEPTGPGAEESALSAGKAGRISALDTIYFSFDSHTLSPAAREGLQRNFAWLAANPAAKVQVEGHCDERGSGEYNLALGERRAKAAVQYLLTLGVASERLQSVSYGEEKPAVPGHDETAWEKNRRAELVVLTEK